MTTTERRPWVGQVRGSPELIRRLSESINAELEGREPIDLDADVPEPESTPEPASEPEPPAEPEAIEDQSVDEQEPEPPASEPEPQPEPPDVVVERALISLLTVVARVVVAGLGVLGYVSLKASWVLLRVCLVVGCGLIGAKAVAASLLDLPAGPPVRNTTRVIWRYAKYVER